MIDNSVTVIVVFVLCAQMEDDCKHEAILKQVLRWLAKVRTKYVHEKPHLPQG